MDVMITQKDLLAISNLIDQRLGLAVERIEEKISHLPTKDEFYAEMLKIYKKQDDLETEKDALVSRTTDNTNRIDSLEGIHPGGKHQAL